MFVFIAVVVIIVTLLNSNVTTANLTTAIFTTANLTSAIFPLLPCLPCCSYYVIDHAVGYLMFFILLIMSFVGIFQLLQSKLLFNESFSQDVAFSRIHNAVKGKGKQLKAKKTDGADGKGGEGKGGEGKGGEG